MLKNLIITASMAIMSTLAVADLTDQDAPDMSDPTAIYSSAGVSYGKQGLNLKLAFAMPSEDRLDYMGAIEAKEDFDIYRVRLFAGESGKGFYLDTNHDTSKNITHVSGGGLMTIPVHERFTLFPAVMVGHMNGKHIESTMTFTAMTYTRLTLDNGWWLNFNPIYTVSLDNSSISDLSMEVFASKQITPTFNARLKFDSSNDNLSFELNKAF